MQELKVDLLRVVNCEPLSQAFMTQQPTSGSLQPLSVVRGENWANRQVVVHAAASPAWPTRPAGAMQTELIISLFCLSNPESFAVSRVGLGSPISFHPGNFPGLVTQGGVWHQGRDTRTWLWVAFFLSPSHMAVISSQGLSK